PPAAQASIGGERFSQRRAEVISARQNVGVRGQFKPGVHLKERAARQQLTVGGRRLKNRRPTAGSLGRISRGRAYFAEHAEDGTPLQVVKQIVFVADQ